jgi:large subunit ribosomal protein L22
MDDDAASSLSRQYVAISKTPKLKPHIVRRRLARLRTYEGSEKNIRHSPWRLNLVCRLAAGLPLPQAMTQLQFCHKWAAPLVQNLLRKTSNLADIRDGLQPSQLEVAECFATPGSPLKRMKIMGRGRTGKMEHRHSHARAVLREIDFKLKIYQAPTLNQKRRWIELQRIAQQDGDRSQAERKEIERLEKKQAKSSAMEGESKNSANVR